MSLLLLLVSVESLLISKSAVLEGNASQSRAELVLGVPGAGEVQEDRDTGDTRNSLDKTSPTGRMSPAYLYYINIKRKNLSRLDKFINSPG